MSLKRRSKFAVVINRPLAAHILPPNSLTSKRKKKKRRQNMKGLLHVTADTVMCFVIVVPHSQTPLSQQRHLVSMLINIRSDEQKFFFSIPYSLCRRRFFFFFNNYFFIFLLFLFLGIIFIHLFILFIYLLF